jgi:hypothetical protein
MEVMITICAAHIFPDGTLILSLSRSVEPTKFDVESDNRSPFTIMKLELPNITLVQKRRSAFQLNLCECLPRSLHMLKPQKWNRKSRLLAIRLGTTTFNCTVQCQFRECAKLIGKKRKKEIGVSYDSFD